MDTARERREDVDDVRFGEAAVGRGVHSVHEDDALEGSRDAETVKGIVDRACFGQVDDSLTILAAGRKKAGERREEADFDRQR